MALYAVTDTQLTNIADSIRAKAGTTEPIGIDDMPTEIGKISGGGPIDSYEYEYVMAEDFTSTSTTVLVDQVEEVSDMLAKYLREDERFVPGRRIVVETTIYNDIPGNPYSLAKCTDVLYVSTGFKKAGTVFEIVLENGTFAEFGAAYGIRFVYDGSTKYKNGLRVSVQARCGAQASILKAGTYKIKCTIINSDDIGA